MSELAKMARAIESLQMLFSPCQIDRDKYWESAREACEACSEPHRTALLFILSQIAVEMMRGKQ